MGRNKLLNISLLLLILLLVAAFFGCAPKQADKPALTVSIQPQKWLLDRIVGDKYEVTALLQPGTNPETYDPSMNHLMSMQHSLAYFTVGNIGFEQASMDKIRSNFPELKVYNSSEGIELLHGSHGHGDEADPHVWVSVRNAMQMADNMYRRMCEIDPDNKAYFTDNYQQLSQQLQQMDDSISGMLQQRRGEAFLVWHPSLSYYARDYGLRQVSVEAEGKEAGPRQMQQKIEEAKAAKPRVFFTQKEFDSRQAEEMSRATDTRLVPVGLMDYDWDKEMYRVASELK